MGNIWAWRAAETEGERVQTKRRLAVNAVMQPGPLPAILGNSSNLFSNKEFSISGHKLRLNANFCLDPYGCIYWGLSDGGTTCQGVMLSTNQRAVLVPGDQ